MKETLLITLGWLFGLLSPRIIAKIEAPHKRKNLKIAMFAELKTLAVRLAAVSAKIDRHLGTRNKKSLEWEKAIYEKYRNDCPQEILDAMEKLLELDTTQFNALTILAKAADDICLSLKKHSLPFIESIAEQLSIFDQGFQRKILEIQAQLNMLNEQTENGTFFYRLTFDSSCMETNSAVIQENLKAIYIEVQHRSKLIVDKICNILENK